jgi:hypothetical protein
MVFQDVTSYTLVDRYEHCCGTYYLHLQGRRDHLSILKMQVAEPSRMLVPTQTDYMVSVAISVFQTLLNYLDTFV